MSERKAPLRQAIKYQHAFRAMRQSGGSWLDHWLDPTAFAHRAIEPQTKWTAPAFHTEEWDVTIHVEAVRVSKQEDSDFRFGDEAVKVTRKADDGYDCEFYVFGRDGNFDTGGRGPGDVPHLGTPYSIGLATEHCRLHPDARVHRVKVKATYSKVNP